MPAAINEAVRKQIIKQWISGDSRDKIAIDNGVGEGTVSGIVNSWKKRLEDSDYESVRELAVQAKKQGVTDLNELASRFRLYNFIKKSGANGDQIESFIINCNGAADGLPPEKVVDLVNQLFNISKSESIPLEQVPEYIQQKLQQKQKVEEQIKEAEAVLQSKNVSIQAIDEHIHLKEELSKYGLFTKDASKLLNVIKNIEQEGFEAKRIVAKLSSIRPLEKREKTLRNNCAMFAKKAAWYKDILPLAEKIVAMRIVIGELLALDAAVNDAAEQYNLPISTAAFQVINDIRDYNKMGGLKKQLETLCAQVYTVKEVCSNQYQAMVALVKLKSYGITEEHILNLNNYFERNMMNSKINPESLASDLEQYGGNKKLEETPST